VVLSGTPASSTTKTGRHDIAELLLKVALNTKNQSINLSLHVHVTESIKYVISGPFSNFVGERFTYRVVMVVGSCIVLIGYTASAFVNSVEILYLTYGVITGKSILKLTFQMSYILVSCEPLVIRIRVFLLFMQ